jgi:enamine deaminase RidA (YjgF/YER057c/UK114 family)
LTINNHSVSSLQIATDLTKQPTQTMQAFKIQIKSVYGWSDLKSSIDDEEYILETYNTKEEAINEMNDIVRSLNDDPSNYRVVNYLVQEDSDMY